MNRLYKAKSPYLREASHQPVNWYEWGNEAFEKAKEENKPILLSIGGRWCHWCHVMSKECFEDEEIAKIINEKFIAIKVDRDERPDIDKRYQEVVIALTGRGGWPLTAFLTPDGKVFFGGTYFPPKSRWGIPGFKDILLRIAELWEKDRQDLLNYAQHIYQNLTAFYQKDFKASLNESLLKKGIEALLSYVDYTHGGIGMTPKFHHAKAFELLITHHYFNPNNKVLKKAIEITLDKMARGGIYDQLLGGFFRYSTDQEWYIPHFEKMLYDNAELLHLYSLAYQVYRKPLYKKVAEGILNYYKTFGSNPQGGFYASQDADIGDLDEGGYYTFSLEEIKKILEPEEFEVLGLYFDLESEKAILPHSQKYVLSVAREEENIAKILNRPINEIQNLIESAKKKLLNYREKTRPNPFIDKTIYTNWNGLMIEALCTYWKVFSDDWSKDMAEKTARYILKKHYDGINLKHTEGVDGFCEDYFFFVKGLLALFEITQNTEFLEIAVILTERAIELFWDEENWGFFDRNEPGEGLLSIRVKNIQDAPVQSSNGVAPYVLLLLANVSEKSKFLDYAEMSLQAFAKLIENMPTLSYSYFLSLYAYLRGIFKVTTSEYFEDALRIFRPFKFVLFSQIEGLVVCEGKVCQKYKTLSELFGKTVY